MVLVELPMGVATLTSASSSFQQLHARMPLLGGEGHVEAVFHPVMLTGAIEAAVNKALKRVRFKA